MLRPQKKLTFLHFVYKVISRLYQYLLYVWHHKLRLKVFNTKHDISFTVFRESFLDDQYKIRKFISSTDQNFSSLSFIDIGRNHGLVFLYFIDFLKNNIKHNLTINYVGIDPAPLKFVYARKVPENIKINYRIIDRAVVFDDARTVHLKYGENNCGNFNVRGSNFEKRMEKLRDRFEFIEIEVDTISELEILDLVRSGMINDVLIVKIDCKNQTNRLFEKTFDIVSINDRPFLISAERDNSGVRDLSHLNEGKGAIVYSNLFNK